MKSVRIWNFSGLFLSANELNTEIHSTNLPIQTDIQYAVQYIDYWCTNLGLWTLDPTATVFNKTYRDFFTFWYILPSPQVKRS